jgi:hypothetical protein
MSYAEPITAQPSDRQGAGCDGVWGRSPHRGTVIA